MSVYSSRGIGFVVLWAVACAARPDVKTFDKLITKELIASGFTKQVPFSFQIIPQSDTRVYGALYEFPRRDPAEHYACSITVAVAGKLLDLQAYARRRAEFARKYADRGPEYLASEFPAIGKRAQRDFLGAGPGGSAFGVTFTTADGKFDVRVLVSSLLPAGVDDPAFDVDGTGKRIAQLYDRR